MSARFRLDARLADPDPGVRRIAIIEIADAEDDDVPQLAHALRHDAAGAVRAEAARALGGRDHDVAVDSLAEALLDADPAVRSIAAEALSRLKDAAVGQRLLPWTRHVEPTVRCAAFRALRELRCRCRPRSADICRGAC